MSCHWDAISSHYAVSGSILDCLDSSMATNGKRKWLEPYAKDVSCRILQLRAAGDSFDRHESKNYVHRNQVDSLPTGYSDLTASQSCVSLHTATLHSRTSLKTTTCSTAEILAHQEMRVSDPRTTRSLSLQIKISGTGFRAIWTLCRPALTRHCSIRRSSVFKHIGRHDGFLCPEL